MAAGPNARSVANYFLRYTPKRVAAWATVVYCVPMTDGLVIAKTRIPEGKMARLAELAERNERSVAGELRVAIDQHLENNEAPETEGGNN